MLEFSPLSSFSPEVLHSFYERSPYRISDYSAGIKLIWKDMIHPEIAFSHGCMIVRDRYRGKYSFNLPFPIEKEADVSAAIDDISAFCIENTLPLAFEYVPKEFLTLLIDKFPCADISCSNELSDYLYLVNDLRNFAGKKYAGQRNHVRKFERLYPEASFRILGKEDKPLCEEFFRSFLKGAENLSMGAKDELKRAIDAMELVSSPAFVCGGYLLDGKLISFCLCEICADVVHDHIEKALPEYVGAYPATVQKICSVFPESVIYMNREDDAGAYGLRVSKQQYQPVALLKKHLVRVKNELWQLDKIPSLSTDRLILNAIKKSDAADYFRLCTDEKTNKFWGYDYKSDCPSPDVEWFYKDQLNDFKERVALNLAIRYDGKFAGEVILYRFDCKGSCEAGVRILPEFSGLGIGEEAYREICRYAIYGLSTDKVTGKCYKKNLPSKKMLSKLMSRIGEDETFIYFEKKN